MKKPMATKNANPQTTLIVDLMRELATEIDLHYENEDGSDVALTLGKLRRGAAFLQAADVPVPGAVRHVLQRFPVMQES